MIFLSKWIGILVAIGTASACSLSGHDNGASLFVDLSSLEGHGSRYALLNSNGGFMGVTVGNTATIPTSASGFACYGVNVTGPGIADSGHDSSGKDPMVDFYRTLNEANRYCSYRGIVTPPLYLNGGSTEAALLVPPGGLRLVQIVGVNDSTVCMSGVLDDPPGSSGGGGNRFFEIGRAVLNDVFSDRSLTVGMSWPTGNTTQDDADRAARTMDCGDGGGVCSTIGGFAASAGASATPSSTYTQFAQRIAATPGKYLKSVDLNLSIPSGTTEDVTVTIYSSVSGDSIPSSSTNYANTLTLTGASSYVSATFPIGTSGNYLLMQSGYDYWIVVSTAHADTTQWRMATGSGSDIAKYDVGTSSWTAYPGQTLDYRIQACD